MLTIQETFWQLVRNKGRTLILVLASAMLAGCVAFYLGNIRANEEAIDRLAETLPVEVRITNPGGDLEGMLNINEHRRDNFLSSQYLRDFTFSIYCEGEYSEESRKNSYFANEETKDTYGITPSSDCFFGVMNTLLCLYAPDAEFTYADSYDETMFQSDEAICLVGVQFAEEKNIKVGDEISMPIYTMSYTSSTPGTDTIYHPLGEQAMKVVGTYASNVNPKDVLAPVGWLVKLMESEGVEVNYNEMGATMKNPRQLSVFKESIADLGFMEPNPDGYMDFTGAAIVVDDELYVTSAETLGQTVVLFKRFQAPFFALVIAMIILAIFLIMRGSRRVIAISISLGRPRFLCAAGCFLAAFTAELLGCALVLPFMVLLAGLSIEGALTICGMFLLCACVGNVVALIMLLRFNAFTLLTAVE